MPLSLPRLYAAVVVAAATAWLLAWRPFSSDAPLEEYWLELTTVPAAGSAGLPPDATFAISLDEGHGYGLQLIPGTRSPAHPEMLSAKVPPGRIRAIQVLLEGVSQVAFRGGRIRSEAGELLAEIPRSAFQPRPGTRVTAVTGEMVQFQAAPQATDVSLELKPASPLFVPSGREPWIAEVLGYFLLGIAAAYWAQGRISRDRLEPWRRKLRCAHEAARARPRCTLFIAALASAVLSSYPVVFAGKSLVSPNHFVPLLYAHQPAVPGAPMEPQEDPKGADFGAMMWQTLPYSALVNRTLLRDHELPLWNRYSANGVSLLAQHLSMAADPLNLLFLGAEGAWWSWDARFVLAKVLFALGIGLCAWKVTGQLGPSALLAASAPWLGYFAYRFDHPAIFSLCYAPWVLLPWLAVAARESGAPEMPWRTRWLWALLLIAADWAELNSGTGKESSMLLLFMNAGGLAVLLLAARPMADRLRAAALLGAASVLFLLLSAPCWLLFADALRHAFTIYDVPKAYQLQPSLFLGFFDEIFIQDFSRNEYHTSPSLNFLVLAGVLWFLCARPAWRKNPAAFALLLCSLPMAALVFGIIPPAWIVRIPLIGNIQHIHNTFGCVLMVWLLVLAAAGFADARADREAREFGAIWRRLLVTLGALALAYFSFTQAIPQPPYSLYSAEPHLHSRFFMRYVPALLLAAGLLPWAWRNLRHAGVFRRAALAVLGASLLVVHFRHGLHLGTKFDDYVVNPKTGVELQVETPALAALRRELHGLGAPARAVGFGAVFMPGYNVLLELEGLSGAEPLINPYFRQFYTAAQLRNEWGWRLHIEEETLAALKPVYDALGIRYYFRDPAYRGAALPKLRPLAQNDLDLFESAEAWPRAFFTDQIFTYDSPARLVQLLQHGDGRPVAATQGPAPVLQREAYERRQVVSARDYRLTPNTTEFTISASGPGVVVLGESYEEGNFRVTVNGAPAPYFRVDHIYKGINLERAGEYRVRFTYWPRLLTPALALSALGALLIAAASVILLRRPRAAPLSPPLP